MKMLRKAGRWAWGNSWQERAFVVVVVVPPYFIGWWALCLLPVGMWLLLTIPERPSARGPHDAHRYDAL